jgi:hypothetical protein
MSRILLVDLKYAVEAEIVLLASEFHKRQLQKSEIDKSMPAAVMARSTRPHVPALYALACKARLEEDELPSLLTCGTLVADAVNPLYTPGLFQASEGMMFLGMLAVRTRHGLLPAATFQSEDEIFIVTLTLDFCAAERDVFFVNKSHQAMMSHSGYSTLYNNLLLSKKLESFLDTSCFPSPLPATCFAISPNNLSALCFEALDLNFLHDQTKDVFSTICGAAKPVSCMSFSYSHAPNITIVLQRILNGIDLPTSTISTFHNAPVNALRSFLRVTGWAHKCGNNPATHSASARPISSLVNKNVLPPSEKYEIDSSTALRPKSPLAEIDFSVDRGFENFVMRVAFLLCRDQECKMIRQSTFVNKHQLEFFFYKNANWIEPLREVQRMFYPPPTFMVKSDHLLHAYLITATTGVEISLNEAHRLITRHANIVGVDVYRDEIFKGFSKSSPNISYSLSESFLVTLMKQKHTLTPAYPSPESMLADMERLVRGFENE